MTAVTQKDRTAWLQCFTEDAVLRDPVGGSPLDPEGQGITGHDGLKRFWDTIVAPAQGVQFDVREEYISGSSVARVATVTIDMGPNQTLEYGGVFIYDLAADGRIEELRGYFQFPDAS